MAIIDLSFQAFKNKLEFLKKYNHADISESDTRSKIIDTIFKEILGWSEFDIERERFVRVGYYDYEISTSFFRFVVEAKKASIEFILPEKVRKVKLKTLYKANKEVITQIRTYLIERSLLYGIVTNGKQFIVAKFINTDGSEWLDNNAIIYQDLDTIEEDFIKFYELLSKESVSRNGRFKIIEDAISGKTLVKSNNLKRKDDELIRNQESQELIPIITDVFEEIYSLDSLNEENLLHQCYVKNEDVKKYNSELGFIFSDLPPNFDGRINPIQNTEKTHALIKGEIYSPTNRLPDPIIIIGGKGAGKTTFIKYFLEVVLDKGTKKNRPQIYLDFRNETENTVKNTKAIYQKILGQLIEKYANLNLTNFKVLKLIYKIEIEHQKKSFWEHLTDDTSLNIKISEFIERISQDPILHLKKISDYLIHQVNKRLCIVIDNADQLEDAIQKEVFILAHSLHRNLNSIAIISLREGYFFKFKNKPPFDAYHSTVFHITAPPYREVLKKRINYILNKYKFNTVNVRKDNLTLELTQGSLHNLFTNLYKTLFEQTNSEILSFLEETSYPNIRNGLERFKYFLLSGHTKTNIYMSFEYGKGDKNSIPIWEFVKSVALELNYYYHSDTSLLFNLFYPSPSNKNHFTKIRILDFIIENNEGVSKKNNFVPTTRIVEIFIKAGYTSDIIVEELNSLYKAGLIFTNNHVNDIEEEIKISEVHDIGITQTGVYYSKNLLKKFFYYDLILQDTPIYDEAFFKELTTLFPECDMYGNRDLNKRKESLKKFVDYLISQEKLDHNRKELNYNINSLDKRIMETALLGGLSQDLERIDRYLSMY